MENKFNNLIAEIKKMIEDEQGLYEIRLVNECGGGVLMNNIEKIEPVRLSDDKAHIICLLYHSDTLEQMVNKLIKADSLSYQALEYKKYKQGSPDLIEALIYNIPKLKTTYRG